MCDRFAEIVPAAQRNMVYAFDRCFEGAVAAFAAPLVGLLAEKWYGFSGASTVTGDRDRDLANARALGSALLAFLAVPWFICLCVYSGAALRDWTHWKKGDITFSNPQESAHIKLHSLTTTPFTLIPPPSQPSTTGLHWTYPEDKRKALKLEMELGELEMRVSGLSWDEGGEEREARPGPLEEQRLLSGEGRLARPRSPTKPEGPARSRAGSAAVVSPPPSHARSPAPSAANQGPSEGAEAGHAGSLRSWPSAVSL